jgi:hypothetical protein
MKFLHSVISCKLPIMHSSLAVSVYPLLFNAACCSPQNFIFHKLLLIFLEVSARNNCMGSDLTPGRGEFRPAWLLKPVRRARTRGRGAEQS